jgi:hypothetical protein
MPLSNFILNILVSLKLLVSKEEEEEQQQQAQEQDAENPFLDPLFSRIKKNTTYLTRKEEPPWGPLEYPQQFEPVPATLR